MPSRSPSHARAARRTAPGFTLIELLVVVAIIALLIAILLPSLGRARKQAKSAACLANLKSFGQAYSLYLTEWDQHSIPTGTQYIAADNSVALGQFWMMPLLAQTQNVRKLRFCPEAPESAKQIQGFGRVDRPYCGGGTWNRTWGLIDDSVVMNTPIASSYGMNGWIYDVSWHVSPLGDGPYNGVRGGWNGGRPVSSFISPKYSSRNSETPLFADALWHEGWPYYDGATGEQPPTAGVYTSTQQVADTNANGGVGLMAARFYTPRHGKAINASYVDGHAEKLPLAEIFKQYWHKNYVVPSSSAYHTGL